MRKFLLFAIVLLITGCTLGEYFKGIRWFIEINGKKYRYSDFKNFSSVFKMESGIKDEKSIINKYVERKILMSEKEISNFPVMIIEVERRIKLFKEKFSSKEEYDKFVRKDKISSSYIKGYFIEDVKIDSFFNEKTRNITLTEEDKEMIYKEISKHLSSPGAQLLLQHKDRFEAELLKSKKNAYREEYISNLLKNAKVYINR